jgi:tetratricopeptide (TPR) repeat protein
MGDWAEKSLALSQALNDSIGLAISLTCLQQAQSSKAGIEQRRRMLEEAIERLQAAEHHWGVTFPQNLLAWQFITTGDLDRAKALLEGSKALCESLDEQAGVYFTLRTLTEIALIQEDVARAKDYVEQRLRMPHKQGDRQATFFTLEHQGCIALQEGDHQRAAQLFEDCLKFWQESGPGDTPTGPARVCLAHIARLQGDYEAATNHLKENLAISQRRGRHDNVASVRLWLGRIALAQGDGETAMTHFKESLEYGKATGNEPLIALGLADVAGVWQMRGDAPRAVRLLGFTSGFCDKVRVAGKPFEREDYENTIAAVCAQLNQPELAAAWAEGQMMTLDEAVAMAVQEQEQEEP